MKDVDERFFLYEQKFKEVAGIKEGMKVTSYQMEETRAHITKLCEDSIAMVAEFKTESIDIISEIKKSTARVSN